MTSRRAFLLAVLVVAVDCSRPGLDLVSYDGQTLPEEAVSRVILARTQCACHKQCVLDNACTGVTTFSAGNGSIECHFSATSLLGPRTLSVGNQSSVSTLLKVVPNPPTTLPLTTTKPTTTTRPPTTTTTTTSTTPTSTTEASITTTAPESTPSYKEVLSGCFYFSTNKENYEDAKNECVDKGGELASLSGVDELEKMIAYLNTDGYKYDYYVDLTRESSEFKWGNGEIFRDEHPVEEDTDKEDIHCVRLDNNKDPAPHNLKTVKCDDKKRFICRK